MLSNDMRQRRCLLKDWRTLLEVKEDDMIRNVPVDLMGSSCLQWCVKDEDGLCELSAVNMQISLFYSIVITPCCYTILYPHNRWFTLGSV